MEYPNSPRLMCQFASGEQHFLVCMGYKTIRIDVSDGFQNLIIEILLHFCDVSHSFFCETLELCNILKLNEDEAGVLSSMLGLKSSGHEAICHEMQERYGLQMVILMCGAEYSLVIAEDMQSKIATPKVKIADTVGAGDSFAAVFIATIMQGASIAAAHELAVDVSAFVCTQRGVMPYWPQELKDELYSII